MITYPTLYDIQQFLASQKRGFLSEFAQKRGIILINASKEDLIKELSSHLLELSDLEAIRDALFQSSTKQALSGFLIKPINPDFDLGNLYSRLREYGTLQSKGYSLEALTKVVQGERIIFHGKISYTKHKLGKIELMQGEKYDTSFSFFEKSDNSWQVEVDGNNSSDGKEVMKLIQMAVKTNPVDINSLKIDSLSIEQVIIFFDKLAREGFDRKSWELVDIRALTFRRRNNSSSLEDDEDINDGVESVGEEDLGGISQAVLAGRNLREHSFVKEAEKSGCIFTSMTYEFKATKSSHFINIKAEFKGSPKIFEVSVISTGKVEGTTKRKITEQTTSLYRREKASEFWNNAHNIYLNLTGQS